MFRPICLSAFFMSNSGVHTESRTEPFIWITRVDCFSSVKHDQVQVLSYRKYSLLVLPFVGIEPVTSIWFHSEALSNQKPYPLSHVSLPDNWFLKYTNKKMDTKLLFLKYAYLEMILNQSCFLKYLL